MRPIKTPTFILPTLLRYLVVAVLIAGGVWYGAWQGRHLIMGPELSIISAPTSIENERVVFVSGQAENATALYLNGRPIAVDENGAFTEGVVLENGYSVVAIDAHDRYGRSFHWEQPVVYLEEKAMAERTDEKQPRSGL